MNLDPELLSPAGDWDCARAAVAAGADAIYFGLPLFNARLRAKNFTDADLPALMSFLHRHGVRGFVAMNTLIFGGELELAERQLRKLADCGVDAVIIQDLGLARLAAEVAPEVELHASTQMTLTSPEGLAYVDTLFPLKRAVLARELSVKEIERFGQPPLVPLEVFVHGALCVSYSGQCLTSESLGQRSANRGECAQACRMPYELVVDGKTMELDEVRYLLSPQDLAAVDLVPALVRAGVKSFKIEGRLKSPEYVTAVTHVYRKALDAAMEKATEPITAEDRYALEMTFSRGLSTGWLAGTNHPYLTHGRYGKKRGPLLGAITEVGDGYVCLDLPPAAQNPPLKVGDGVVFDAGEDRNQEQGAAIWKIDGERILFHRRLSGLDFSRIRPGMGLFKTADPALDSRLRHFWKHAKLEVARRPMDFIVSGAVGEKLRLEARADALVSVQESSRVLQEADKHALDREVLEGQLGRLGDTDYELGVVENRLNGRCHIALSELNRLRRAAVADLVAQRERPSRSSAPDFSWRDLLPETPSNPPLPGPARLSVLARTLEQLEAALACEVEDIYCDFEDPRRCRDAVERKKGTRSRVHLATPRILKPGELGYLKLIERCEPDGLLLRNLGSLEYFRAATHFVRTGDFSLNVANPLTARLLRETAGLEAMTISYDLNIGQVMELLSLAPPQWFELTLHQHMPMFHMEHCVFCVFLSEGTSYKDCGRPCEKHVVHLRDRVGQLHRLQADVGCRNTLFNGRAQSGARYYEPLRKAGLERFRIELLDEDEAAAVRTIRAYQSLISGVWDAAHLLEQVSAAERLGVTEGTLLQTSEMG